MTTTTIRVIELCVDGHITEQTFSTEGTGAQLCQLIGCDLFDVVGLVDGIDLFVDDEGINRGAALNLPATVLAHVLGASAVLFGTAIAVSVDEEGETIGLTDDQVARICAAMRQRPDPATVQALADSLSPFPGIVAMLRG